MYVCLYLLFEFQLFADSEAPGNVSSQVGSFAGLIIRERTSVVYIYLLPSPNIQKNVFHACSSAVFCNFVKFIAA